MDSSDAGKHRSRGLPPLAVGLAATVVEHRREQGLSQEQLAASLGWTPAQVIEVESGDEVPPWGMLTVLARAGVIRMVVS